jgi:peptidoglycan/LPS O-acetylase OafA/YrhL
MAWFLPLVLSSISVLKIWAADASPGCLETIENMMSQSDHQQFLRLALSSGKLLPYDAGKYTMCMDGGDTRYFLVEMDANLPTNKTKTPYSLKMKMGLCMPNVCDNAGVVALVNSSMSKVFLPELALIHVANITATSPQLNLKQEDFVGVIALVAVSSLIGLVLISTCITLTSQVRAPQHDEPRGGTPPRPAQSSHEQLLQQNRNAPLNGNTGHLASNMFVKAFSLVGSSGTLTKLVEIPNYEPTHSLNGMRVINMAWIILGHTFLMPEGISGYANQEDIADNPLNSHVAEKNPLFQIILGAQAGVDTFFFLSGFLLAFLTLEELRRGKMSPIYAIVMRYFRLTPSLALVLLVYYKIWAFLGHGPFAVSFQDSINGRCDGSWWSELTYTLNFVPFDSNKVCMGWTWYLGDDMIFFIIAIFLLPVYHRTKLVGWFTLLAISAISFAVTTLLVIRHHLSIYVFDDHYKNYSYYAYSKPYTRIPAYFVGIMAAWLVDMLKDRGFTRQTRPNTPRARTMARIAACCSILVILGVIFITYFDFGDNKDSWGDVMNVLYINLSRPIFAAAWAVLALLCYYDYLPFINAFLAHWCWTPLARLTYGAYLVHPLVIKLAAGRALQFYSFSAIDIAYRWVGNVVLAHLGSVALWVLCERPCITISSSFRKKRAPQKVTDPGTPELGGVPQGLSLNRVVPPPNGSPVQRP